MDSTPVWLAGTPSPMNHLPDPFDATHPNIAVEFTANVDEYDGGTFLGYPSRQGWSATEVRYPRGSTHSLPEIERFFQLWLWVGLLSEFFRRPIRSCDIIVVKDGKQLVTTRALHGMIAKWIFRERKFSTETKKKRAAHLDQVLWCANTTLAAWSQDTSFAPFRDPWMRISIIIICEALDLAFVEIYGAFLDDQKSRSARLDNGWPSDGIDSAISTRMRQDGWCNHTIRKTSGPFSNSVRYFMGRMKQPGSGASHDKCSMDKCNAYEISAQSYETKHTSSTCTCDFISVNTADIATILSRGHIPVIRLVEDQIEVVEAVPELNKYVAFSHVWSDGLGNESSNSLPLCQLRRLSNLVLPHVGHLGLFWIDTLCCPRTPKEARNQAIVLMRKTYKEAYCTLVLDSYLLGQPLKELSNAEALAMVSNSTWNSRLWTYEECVLARSNLFFQFDDCAMNINEHVASAAAEIYLLKLLGTGTGHLTDYLPSSFFLGPQIIYSPPYISNSRTLNVLTLQSALENRQTTHLADEPVCLATLLGLDVQAVLSSAKDKRMETFWRLVQRVPSDVVFWSRGTLDVQGFRWAPKTFLAGLGFVGATANNSRYGVLSGNNGLVVVYPGWTLGCSPGGHIAAAFNFVLGTDRAFGVTCYTEELRDAINALKYSGDGPTIPKRGNLFGIFNPWEMTGEQPHPSTELALITQTDFEASPHLEDHNAALVVVTRFKGNVRYVRKACAAAIRKQPLETISPMAQATLRNMRQQFSGRSLPAKWVAGNEKEGVQFSDFMSGVSTKGEAFWCVD